MHKKDETFVARIAINVAPQGRYHTFETSLAHLDKREYSRLFLLPPDRPRTLIFAVGWHSCSGFEVVETIWWNLFFN
ncbi:hypothetical protein A4V03_19455 [Bacteroides caecimuris]|jgi:hypothetical protein|uniref:Uncharacterized protein n=1 Tax=Bacteroides caecimuris TaxID=1796613 RepID=A0A1C7H6H2_9BACE|nr:hypothetical protein A4V03_19455 [Bacteroides caecimuris]